ncbi:uroporphyrinogen-III synthase [Robbsia sp. Bb-Pol-6]|uniref:Uroporphyrinogen-III synthase n=1 Tax=Robbsia betulipollinis TaxID=2981849 RepID=A0ABT3ZLR4_9BURK|nr:uroporphyrinogen-III synthase [Robbsia betulipollinis]
MMPERAPARRSPLGVVLTRPAGQSAPLAAALARLAPSRIRTIDFPLIEIRASADPGALDTALRRLARFALVFFVSPNAIEQAFARGAALGIDVAAALGRNGDQDRDRKRKPGPGPGRGVLIAAVGPGSVQALAAHGVRPGTHRLLAPAGALEAAAMLEAAGGLEAGPDPDAMHADADADAQRRQAQAEAIRYDSEALLDALARSGERPALAGGEALIVRGDGGRELFADALRDAGMTVHAVTAYERHVPAPSAAVWQPICRLLEEDLPHVWVLSSSEGVRNLDLLARAHFAGSGDARHAALKHARVIVPHPRIAAAASRAGFDTITHAGAGDANLLRAILAASDPIAHDEHDRR